MKEMYWPFPMHDKTQLPRSSSAAMRRQLTDLEVVVLPLLLRLEVQPRQPAQVLAAHRLVHRGAAANALPAEMQCQQQQEGFLQLSSSPFVGFRPHDSWCACLLLGPISCVPLPPLLDPFAASCPAHLL